MLIGANDAPVDIDRRGASTQFAVTPLPESAAAAAGDTPRTYLNVTDIEGSRKPGVIFGVYLNLPAGTASDARDDYLAGIVSFFGIEKTDPHAAGSRQEPHGMRYTFDVTGLVDRLRAQGQWDPGRVSVSMLPAVDDDEPEPLGAAVAARVRVGTFSLYQG